ncbi:P-loop containing nucleoside triphosphate hydrolase protein [Panus rudis PR-1116 ss-1]|nr:P-loop containing nucleoside triphosphate hydrolase protein [Panus rudis PR-1116 ss-1]
MSSSDQTACRNSGKDVLQKVRSKAEADKLHDSAAFRREVSSKFMQMCNKSPYPWQLDVAEATALRLNCITIAGTGAGKTMPFVMPLMTDKTKSKRVLIISPLDELENDQALRFQKMGLSAVAVNGTSYTPQLHKELEDGKYQVVITSPEMCFRDTQFAPLLLKEAFTKTFVSIVIDEAHCIHTWGPEFRTDFAELAQLRSWFTDVPILATSATIPPAYLTKLIESLDLMSEAKYEKLCIFNLGNDRPNLIPIICRMAKAKDFSDLDFVLDEVNSNKPLQRTMLFVNSRATARLVCLYLRSLLPATLQMQVDFLHSMRDNDAKKDVMRRFRSKEIRILVATEAAGMGMDISDIVRVIQYGVPDSITTWAQRYGRAGRNGQLAVVILLVEPSVFQRVKARGEKQPETSSEDEDNTDGQQPSDPDKSTSDEDSVGDTGADGDSTKIKYKKNVDFSLREYLETKQCRRKVSNSYFDNPLCPESQRDTGSNGRGPCCDLCVYGVRSV